MFIIPAFAFGAFAHVHLSGWIIPRAGVNIVITTVLVVLNEPDTWMETFSRTSGTALSAAMLAGLVRTLIRVCAIFRYRS